MSFSFFSVMLRVEPRSLCMPGKHSINRITSSAEPVVSPVSGSPEYRNYEHGALCFVLIHFALRVVTPWPLPYTRTDMLNLSYPCTRYTLVLRFVILLLQVLKCWDYSSAIFFSLSKLVSLHSPGWSQMHEPSTFAWDYRHTWFLGNSFLLSA